MAARVAWIVIAAQLAAVTAHGDPAEDAALDHLDRGVAAFRAGDFASARAELGLAQRLAPDRPNPYRWLALTELELGDCRSALIDVESFLSRVPAGDPRVAEVVAVRGRCVATGSLRVESTPSGAAIRLDGGPPVATTPTPNLALAVGVHRLMIEKPGYVAQAAPLEVRAMGVTYARYTLIVDRGEPAIYRRWWFWAAAGAVAITAAATTYAVTRGGGARLPPVTCGPAGCQP